jgi:Icc-related predicted phosphoesterase
LNAGKFYEASVLVMGGDITGKLLIPIIKEKNGHFRATLQGTTEHYESETELEGLMERLGTLPLHPGRRLAKSQMRNWAG